MLDEATLGHLNLTEFTREDARWQSPHEIVERDGVLLFAGSSDFMAFCNGVRRVDDDVPGVDVIAMAEAFFESRAVGSRCGPARSPSTKTSKRRPRTPG